MSGRSNRIVSATASQQIMTSRRMASVERRIAQALNQAEQAAASSGRVVPLQGLGRQLGRNMDETLDSLAMERARGLARAWNRAAGRRVFGIPAQVNVGNILGDLSGRDMLDPAERSARAKLAQGMRTASTEAEKRAAAQAGTNLLRNGLRTMAVTAANAVQNAAALAVMATSPEVDAVAIVVILDDRTSDICLNLAGGIWDVVTGAATGESAVADPFPGSPPYHYRCRSSLAPVLASHAPPTVTSVDEWIAQHPEDALAALGAEQVDLWRRGLLPHSQLVDQSARPIDDIEAAAGEAAAIRDAGPLEPRPMR